MKLYKVIIVDDEYLIRQRLRFGFEWGKMGYELTGEASNGIEAIELIDSCSPDVAIIDIAMPSLNGLELTKLLRSKGNELKIILLTGHSKFEYAREALLEHVYYYMLKPLDEDEFIKILQELAAQLKEESLKRDYLQHMENEIDNAKLILEGKLFHDFFTRDILTTDRDEITKKFRKALIDDNRNNFILLLEIEKFEAYPDEQEIQETITQLSAKFNDILCLQTGCRVIYDIYDGLFIVLLSMQEQSGFSDRECLAVLLDDARVELKRCLNSKVFIGIGTVYAGIEGLLYSYQEALTALRNRIIFSGKEVIDYDSIKAYIGKKYSIGSNMLSELIMNMQSDNFTNIIEILKSVFKDINSEHILYKEIQGAVGQIVAVAEKFAFDNGIDVQDVMGEYDNIETMIKEADSVGDICTWCIGVIESLLDRRRALLKRGRNTELAHKVQIYISDNFADPELSLEGISGSMYIAPTYVSSNFKKVMGISIMQYITKIRLEKAKVILEAGNSDIKTAAELTGYSDEYYFSRCFKKYFGISPSNYVRVKLQDKYNS